MIQNFIQRKVIEHQFPLITKVKEDIVYIDEPIVTLGYNSFMVPIVALLVDEDNEYKRYMNVMLLQEDVDRYLREEISLRDLVQSQERTFIHDVSTDSSTHSQDVVFEVETASINDSYFPGSNSVYPHPKDFFTASFEVKVRGGYADKFLMLAKDSAMVLAEFNKIIKSIGNSLNLQNKVQLLSNPPQSGSHKIEFLISAQDDEGQTDFTVDTLHFSELYMKIINYSWNALIDDAPNLTFDSYSESSAFVEIINLIKSFLEEAGYEEEEIESNVLLMLLDISSSNNKLTKILKSGYSDFAINSIVADGEASSVAYVETNKALQMQMTYASLDRNLLRTMDEIAEEYCIHVYDLNSETGNGWVELEGPSDATGSTRKARLQILDQSSIENSAYTQSISTGEFVTIQGRAERVRGKVTKLFV